MIKSYLQYLMKAKNAHGLHSPFVFDLYTKAITPPSPQALYAPIEALRAQLLQDSTLLHIEDLGAGSKRSRGKQRSVRQIARYAAEKASVGQLLMRLTAYFQPSLVLDLGTSLGITTAYLALGHPKAEIVSFEGAEALRLRAKEHFQSLGLQNIRLVGGNLNESLPQQVKQLPAIDFVFFDANHRYIPTINYFTTCLSKAHEDSVFVFDDIHWSKEMEQAWEEIKEHPEVQISIDLFHIGIVFFRKKQPKQHFVLKF